MRQSPHLAVVWCVGFVAAFLVIAGCTTAGQRPVRLLPQDIEEEPLVVKKVSRMGFQLPVGSSVAVPLDVPRDARSLVIAFALPDEGADSATCRALVRAAHGSPFVLFARAAQPGVWQEEVIDLRAYAGQTVELTLTSDAPGEEDYDSLVYWGTPIVTRQSREPSIILISIDSMRADHLSCCGYRRPTSPNLDSLASTGYLFTQGVAQSSWTLPSHASLLTSLYVKSHGACGAREGVAPDVVTLAEELRGAGYLTAGFVSGPFLLPEYGLHQGFDVYDARCSSIEHADSHHDVTNPCMHRRAVEWLEKWGHTSFFLFLHYWDVHYDYIPPAPYDTIFDPDYDGTVDGRNFAKNERIRAGMPARDLQHIVALYDGEIAYTDAYLGKLFRVVRRLGLHDRTLVIVTSDHGDEFLEHGATGHGHTLYQELIRIPVLWVEPGGTRGPVRVNTTVQLIDIAPSILEFAGIEPSGSLEGRSFLPLLEGKPWGDGVAFSETRSGGFLKAAVGEHAKIIRAMLNGQTTAYDLRHDPGERAPIAPDSLAAAMPLQEALTSFLEEGHVALELRVVGEGESGESIINLVMTDPPVTVHPHALEPDDSLQMVELPPAAILWLRCPAGDVDGLTAILPSAGTTVKVDGWFEGSRLEPDRVLYGMGNYPDKLPLQISSGSPLLRVPPTNVPQLSARGPLLYVWKVDERALATMKVELDKQLAEQLRALGYLR